MATPATGEEQIDFKFSGAFSSYSVASIDKVRKFYGETLGVSIMDEEEGIGFKLPGQGLSVFLYPKEDHAPASFTVLNFQVADVKESVDALTERGVTFEQYKGEMQTDEDGIFWGSKQGSGPNIAWFKDPAGNILSLIEETPE